LRRREEEQEDVHREELLVRDTSFANSTEQEERRIKRKLGEREQEIKARR